ncbi:hypothetical protein [Cryobacterium tagatosivorans]|uniref:Uncharacterized protein n=1 Tax=Cryobacterium tagatosivorans TaxID=1259199 RepID=A0A4R8UBN6_9MICO|nr:hypothetical protein [Cryobacterium tagatosivorans]TFB48254.1 hypothetical protein E3O23_13870 [Cryobacterium tagatosivorans]
MTLTQRHPRHRQRWSPACTVRREDWSDAGRDVVELRDMVESWASSTKPGFELNARVSMAEVWSAYLAPHPFDFSLVRETPTRYVMRISQTKPMPPELSVIFGEWLFNMRSALDYTIWATAVHTSGQMPPPGEGGLQYPIYDEEASWGRNEWRLNPLGKHHREMLHMMQPFKSDLDANYLGWINRLARIDRHRRLTIWTARLGEINPIVRVPSGSMPHLEWGQKVFDAGICDMARMTFRSVSDADEVEFNPRCAIDPEIAEWSESSFWGRIRFSERLNLMQVFVSAEIDLYEYDCTGEAPSTTVAFILLSSACFGRFLAFPC